MEFSILMRGRRVPRDATLRRDNAPCTICRMCMKLSWAKTTHEAAGASDINGQARGQNYLGRDTNRGEARVRIRVASLAPHALPYVCLLQGSWCREVALQKNDQITSSLDGIFNSLTCNWCIRAHMQVHGSNLKVVGCQDLFREMILQKGHGVYRLCNQIQAAYSFKD